DYLVYLLPQAQLKQRARLRRDLSFVLRYPSGKHDQGRRMKKKSTRQTSDHKSAVSAMNIRIAPLALALAACALAGCATYSKVSERRPSFNPVPPGHGEL